MDAIVCVMTRSDASHYPNVRCSNAELKWIAVSSLGYIRVRAVSNLV